MEAIQRFISQLLSSVSVSFHRYGIVLNGDTDWQLNLIGWTANQLEDATVFQLGGTSIPCAQKSVPYNKGQQFLGQECNLLLCDLRESFDANSFSAALGCLKGGGLLFILPPEYCSGKPDEVWFNLALVKLFQVGQNLPIPRLPQTKKFTQNIFQHQITAVDKIRNVVEGHRKRPLIMLADRGRGKSSALGIAAAELIQSRVIHIIVCAPTLSTVQPIFEHASRLLNEVIYTKGCLIAGQSKIEFVAPDELLRHKPNCDCLFVDEASAIPIPMLQEMVQHYNRIVFSTTVHGYEGCGRGFTIKFQSWLLQNRPGTQLYTLSLPIRWAESDPLEKWLFDSFLLNTELPSVETDTHKTKLMKLNKEDLLLNPVLLCSCFALLVNAHYQTTPNDLMLLLGDDAINVFASFQDDVCIGCLLTVSEGALDNSLVQEIQQGRRRPKGHLVATQLATQLGITEAALQVSLRIMRIAVHPQLQRQGIGQQMLTQLQDTTDYDFYSTSFGATSELIDFWYQSDFVPVKLGSGRDQSSGTHSVIMISRTASWIKVANNYYRMFIQYSLPVIFNKLDCGLVRRLAQHLDTISEQPFNHINLILAYTSGGTNYDSIAPIIDAWWKSSPRLVQHMSDLILRKVVQQADWHECADSFHFSGRKSIESQFKLDLVDLISSCPVT